MINISNIAVFIDFENFGDEFDAKKIITKLKEKGRILLKKAYADWGRYYSIKRTMMENSIDLIELPSHSNKGKNSSDIKLVVDALETALVKDYIDTFVVVSGDSDYTPLISKLRELNKYVIVIGHKKNMSSLLAGYCDEIYYYNNFVGNTLEDGVSITKLTSVYDLLIRSLKSLNDIGSNTLGSRVKQYMRQLDATFDESQYGFSSLRAFWYKAGQDKIIRYKETATGDFEISLYDGNDKNKEVLLGNKLDDKQSLDIMLLVYWTILVYPLEMQKKLDINLVAQGIRQFDADFSLSKYGYSQNNGFKGIILRAEQEKWIKVFTEKTLNNVNYYIQPLDKMINVYENVAKPHNFEKIKETIELSLEVVKYRKHLREKGYYIDLDKINGVYGLIYDYVFDMPNYKNVNLGDIITYTQGKLADSFSEQNITMMMKTFVDSGLFLDEDEQSITNPISKTLVCNLNVDSSYVCQYIQEFLSEKLVDEFKNNIDARKLQFLFYKEI